MSLGKGEVAPTHIWCPSCNEKRPLLCDQVQAEISGDFVVTDLICDFCKLIIATLFG